MVERLALPTVLEHPPTGVDVLLMEGTTIGRARAAAKFPTEEELEACFIERMRAASGMVLSGVPARTLID